MSQKMNDKQKLGRIYLKGGKEEMRSFRHVKFKVRTEYIRHEVRKYRSVLE